MLLNIITFFAIFYKISLSGTLVPIKYTVLGGVEMLGKPSLLYLLPVSAALLSVLNLIIYQKLKKSRDFFSPFLALVSVFLQGIFLLSSLLLAIYK